MEITTATIVLGVLLVLVMGAAVAGEAAKPGASQVSGTQPSRAAGKGALPFTLAVKDVTPPSLPEYLQPYGRTPPSGQIADYPISPVVIDGELWVIHKNGYSDKIIRYKGTDIEKTVRQPDGRLNPKHSIHGTVVHPYLLGRMWYAVAEKKLYAPMHCEYKAPTSGPGIVLRQVHLAASADKGLTWNYEGPLLTGETSVSPLAHSGTYWEGGDGDFYLYVDEPGGYFYIFTTFYLWPKPGVEAPYFMRHRVARCKLSDKMGSGKWHRWYNGDWTEPGIGGKSSYVDAHCVIYSTYLRRFLSFNYGSGLAVCDDLAKQDWSPHFFIPGDCWGTQKNLEITPMNEGKTDTWKFDRTMYVYTYLQGWNAGPGHRFRLDFGPGETPDVNGYVAWGAGVDAKKFFDPNWEGRPATDPLRPYGEPSYDSADPIEGRRTRKVGPQSVELACSGNWLLEGAPFNSKASGTAQDSLSFTFKGGGIYWRAAQGPDCGMADILLDGVLQKTVDCYGIHSPHRFWFVKTDLDPALAHTIRIVVRGDKNLKSSGTFIRHLSFEYSAESNRASDGFSGVMGKNDWHYLTWEGAAFAPLEFNSDNTWRRAGQLAVGPDWLMPGEGWAAVRQWIAPHGGTVRVEGEVGDLPGDAAGVKAQVCHRPAGSAPGQAAEIWSAELPSANKGPVGHDVERAVRAGDAITFSVSNLDVAGKADTGEVLVRSNTGQVERNRLSLKGKNGGPLKIGTKEFSRGLFCHAPSKLVVRLPAPGKRFSAIVGVDAGNDQGARGSVVFSLSVGGKTIYKSGLLKGKMEGVPVEVGLAGAREVVLEVSDGGDGIGYDWSDWAEVKVLVEDNQEIWLGDLPLHERHTLPVHWNPLITYVSQ